MGYCQKSNVKSIRSQGLYSTILRRNHFRFYAVKNMRGFEILKSLLIFIAIMAMILQICLTDPEPVEPSLCFCNNNHGPDTWHFWAFCISTDMDKCGSKFGEGEFYCACGFIRKNPVENATCVYKDIGLTWHSDWKSFFTWDS